MLLHDAHIQILIIHDQNSAALATWRRQRTVNRFDIAAATAAFHYGLSALQYFAESFTAFLRQLLRTLRRFCERYLLVTEQRQIEVERGAFTRTAAQNDLRAVQLHQLLGNRQPQTRATLFATGRRIDLIETIEDARLLISGNSDSGVLHHDPRIDIDDLDGNGHPAALRELDGIGDEIEENLLQTILVPHHQHRL